MELAEIFFTFYRVVSKKFHDTISHSRIRMETDRKASKASKPPFSSLLFIWTLQDTRIQRESNTNVVLLLHTLREIVVEKILQWGRKRRMKNSRGEVQDKKWKLKKKKMKKFEGEGETKEVNERRMRRKED